MNRLLKYLATLALVTFCGNAFAGLTVSQSAKGSGANPTATFSSSVSSGSVIFAIIAANGWAGTLPTVTDNVNSGSYSQLGCYHNTSYGYLVCEYWIVANSTGTPTVSVSYSGYYATVYVGQVTGFAGTPTADSSIVADFSGSGTTISVSPATTNYNNEIMLIGLTTSGGFGTSGSGAWNTLGGCTAAYNCPAVYSIEVTSGTTDNFSATLSASSDWIALLGGIYDGSGPFNPMGINFPAGGSVSTYAEGFPIFKNRVRESPGFTTSSIDTEASVDANGWPNGNFDVYLWTQESGGTIPSWVAGTWDCGFIGTGSEVIAPLGSDTLSNPVHGTGGAYSTFNLTNLVKNSGFAVTGVTGSVTNVFCYLPEYPGSTIDNPTSATAFTTEAIDHYENYGWIRWMQWQRVIHNSTTATSSNRATPSNFQAPFYNTTGEGIPAEWAISFCLAAKTDCWLNLPNVYDSTFSYITSLANALYAVVPPGRHVYLEISDELWHDAGAGITAWQNAASAYGGQIPYLAYQDHNIASIFRDVFGSRYGSDIRLVDAWQADPAGVWHQYLLFQQYITNGWPINAANGGDFYNTSVAPYMNLTDPSDSMTIAQIDSNLTAQGSIQAWQSFLESITVMGLKWGLPMLPYEGGWQTNTESTGIVNAGASILDSGMTAVMNNYYQSIASSGAIGMTTFSGGVDSNDGNNLSPIDELTRPYPITTADSPRFASIMDNVGGLTPTRNVVTSAGAVVSGGNYLDNSGSPAPSLGDDGEGNYFDSPNYSVAGQVSYLVWCATARTTSLVVNFTNSGSSGQTQLEHGSAPSGYSILGGTSSPTLITIPAGTNNVTIGSVPLAKGWNYVTLGDPGTRQSSITINSLTFN
jgi:hypothetical protein